MVGRGGRTDASSQWMTRIDVLSEHSVDDGLVVAAENSKTPGARLQRLKRQGTEPRARRGQATLLGSTYRSWWAKGRWSGGGWGERTKVLLRYLPACIA